MRFFLPFLAVVLCLPQNASAQLVVESVQVGFPAGGGSDQGQLTHFKAGAWTPIVVRVTAGAKGYAGGKLIVETLDSDDVPNVYTASIPALKSKPVTLCTFTRPGSVGAALTIRAVDRDGRKIVIENRDYEALDFSKQIYLTLGSPLPDLDAAIRGQKRLAGLETDPNVRIRFPTFVGQVKQLPTHWFGYDAVDLMIFPTGNTAFLRDLIADTERQEAIAEWVRRGGRLVISVSSNQGLVRKLLESWDWGAAPVLTAQPVAMTRLDGLVQFAETQDKPFETEDEAHTFRIARLDPGRRGLAPVEILAEEGQEHPLMVRIPYGLGNVTLLAVDLDERPFTAWAGRVQFWQKLVTRLAPKVVTEEDPNDVATELQKRLEVFPDVEPVSFGWVAFIIFVYILVVGPLDYLFLTKVLKRLEWTWITFPLVVVGVSAIAFVAASGRTHDEILVNKIDLIDIDQLAPDESFHGTTWFSLFSPRNESFGVGIKPPRDLLGEAKGRHFLPVITWLGRPDLSGLNSTGRRTAQALLRSQYVYAEDASALISVPVPFASTKSFTATWEGPFKRSFISSLVYDRDNAEHLSGGVTNPLPAALEDPVLFYGGRLYSFAGPLASGKEVALADKGPQEFSQWRTSLTSQPSVSNGAGPITALVSRILFHEKLTVGNVQRNNVLRRLDQSWRLRDVNARDFRPQEAILFGRLPRVEGDIKEISQTPGSASAFALGEPPSAMGSAWPPSVRLIQDTYVRVFLPVRPAK